MKLGDTNEANTNTNFSNLDVMVVFLIKIRVIRVCICFIRVTWSLIKIIILFKI
jgi:hypothetical protein